MSDIYVFPPDAEDFTTIGLVGALVPTECTFSETANGESIIEMTHPLDDFGRFTALVRGNIIVAPVPVRTTPEIQNGHCVTTVWSYKVKPLGQLTHKNQRTLFKAATGKKSIKVMNEGDVVTVVYKPNENDSSGDDSKDNPIRWKAKSQYGTGWIDPAGFDLVTEHKIADNSEAIQEVQSPWSVTPQFFRIYEVKKSIDSVEVSARHISYDLLYNLTKYESGDSVTLQTALNGILNSCYDPNHEFKAYTNVDNEQAGLYYKRKNPIDAFLDPEEGICAKFDVALVRDNYDLYFLKDPGINRGVRIQYSKNMLGIEFTDSDDEIATRIVPIGQTKDDKDLFLSSGDSDQVAGVDYIDSPLINDYPVIHISELKCENCKVDEEEEGAGKVTVAIARERMKAQAQKMIDDGCDKPKIEMSVEFLNLGDTEEYKQFKDLENCFLFDYIVVQHPDLMIDVTAQIVKIEWDCISDRMNSVEIGSVGKTLANVGITTWQIPSGFSGSKLADGTLGGGALMDGIISARHVQADSINTDALQAGSVTAEKLAAGCITAEKLEAGVIDAGLLEAITGIIENLKVGKLDADDLTAKFAQFGVLLAGTAEFDRETVQHLVAEALHLQFGEADSVFIQNLMVTYAQFAAATIGDLVVKASDGNYYHLDVDPETGTVTATPAEVTEGDLSSGHTSQGETIIDTNILAENLSTKNLFATYALINQIDAARIDVDQLFAREAFLGLLWTTKIHGDESIEMWVHNSVRRIVTEYYVSESPSIPAGGEWTEEFPGSVASDKYLWRHIKSYKGQGEFEYTGEECLTLSAGAQGPAGVGIESIEEFYGLSNSAATQPSEWKTEPMPPTPDNRWLWNKETIHYTNQTAQDGEPHIIGVFGEDGKIGRGIKEIINWYLASSESAGITRDTAGWTQEPQATSDEKRYLWNYEETVWNDDSAHSYTNPIIIGTQGKPGQQGLQGLQGERGEDGIDGSPGRDGSDGSSVNLVLQSDTPHQANNSYWLWNYTLSEPFELNQTYTVTIWGELDASKTSFNIHIGSSANYLGGAKKVSEGVYSLRASMTSFSNSEVDKTRLQVYTYPQTADSTSRIDKIKLEKGAVTNPVWTPNPLDLATYFHIKYSAKEKPAAPEDMTETPDVYIGTYVDNVKADSTDPAKYQWYRFQGLQGEKGEQGIPGVGQDGKTYYLHIKYSNDGGKTFTGNNGEDTGDYIGVCTDTNEADPDTPSSYKWSKTKGDNGTSYSNNLLINSNFANGTNAWSNWGTSQTREIVEENGRHWAHIVSTSAGGNNGYQQNTYKSHGTTVIPEKSYTFSAHARGAAEDSTFSFGIHKLKAEDADGGWLWHDFTVGTQEQLVRFDFWMETDCDHFAIMVGGHTTAPQDIYFTDLKLEEGIVASPVWTPSPKDIYYTPIQQYYLSTSDTTQTGGKWTETQPTWEDGKYLWERLRCVWSDGRADTYTTPQRALALEQALQAAKNAQDAADSAQSLANQVYTVMDRYMTLTDDKGWEFHANLIDLSTGEEVPSIWVSRIDERGFYVQRNDIGQYVFAACRDRCLVSNLEIGKINYAPLSNSNTEAETRSSIIIKPTSTGGIVFTAK